MEVTKHNRIYEILLVLYAFGMLLSVGTLAFVVSTVQETDGSTGASESSNALIYMMYVNGLLAAFALATVLLRYLTPDLGRVFTKALNILLLVAFPLGTALGTYGLLKVDRVPASKRNPRGL